MCKELLKVQIYCETHSVDEWMEEPLWSRRLHVQIIFTGINVDLVHLKSDIFLFSVPSPSKQQTVRSVYHSNHAY